MLDIIGDEREVERLGFIWGIRRYFRDIVDSRKITIIRWYELKILGLER